jgi:NAD-dependent dihydropyrimidine dehydrogenase PreA subunit
MKRQIIHIDEDLCDGCGDCVPSCAEGAIQVIDGKAKLVKDALCDGLGACLGDCPQGALTIEERDADEFDEELVEQHLDAVGKDTPAAHVHGGGGCPGSRTMAFDDEPANAAADTAGERPSELRQWPVQLHLVSPMAPYFQGADVLLTADCVPFAMGDFHRDWLKGHALAIACPKLDQGQEVYLQKLVAMIDEAQINTLKVMIMQVPCCGGLLHMAKTAAAQAKRKVPVKQVVVGLRGEILSEDWV